ncbi:copper-binding protein [Aurantimonas sp. C2-6-R+9]|uniref:copper-binding protein n=1 Tax=unclassified Aurantimonas TaxID=2638230 RepID=UPI002E17A453|nr:MULTISPECIES: copper-binding protein [unclassified Aurantimonas]MEC5289900.1 copper-binding protein [Aurantimonas sp. C2-3-R2]MEC5322416.1 copper-binding protein [Aurantimonas sp. A3-2-R12]MEC5379959.1 copper-binding protein [Aurantimonas sp. C2-6-R+9]MEC5410982.1 copper-binding protein [Aurantimonas sp. C2-4-R8]
MTKLIKIAALSFLSLALASPALAVEYTKGQITKIDAKQQKLTIKHGALKNLDMPAMTMVFKVSDEKMLTKAKEGKNIEFVADRVKGKLTVVEMK